LLLGCSPKAKKDIETTVVRRGIFDVNVVETGEIQATESLNISSPAMSWRFGSLKITKLIDDGSDVAKGDTVVLFDPSEVQKAIVDATAELEIAEAELEKLKAEQESIIMELEADVRIAEISHEISEIELEQAAYESDIVRKEIKLNLDKARISLDKAKEEIANKKDIHREERHQAELKIQQLNNNLEEANVTLRNLTVLSVGSGVAIILKNWRTGNKWQVGDQPWSGTPLISLPDLRELKVKTEINEVDISKIILDQEVEIRLDAFSDTVFAGEVMSVAALAKHKEREKDKKSKIKIFPVDILIDGSSAQLMPGMTVSCKLIIDKIEDVLFVPLEAVTKNDNADLVYVKSGDSFKERQVIVGQANNDYVIIESGLEEGEEIALSNPYREIAKAENKSAT
jgi:multidrug efflux pump subunit AcrA (membrane-fusion protein)